MDSFGEPGERAAGGPPRIEVLGGVTDSFILAANDEPVGEAVRQFFLSEQVGRDVRIIFEGNDEFFA
jgi:hypothetical protein